MKHAVYHIVKAAAMILVALALTGCRATSRVEQSLRTDSVSIEALSVKTDSVSEQREVLGYDSIVTLTFDTLGRIVSQTTAVRHSREKATRAQGKSEAVQTTATQTSVQQKAKETAKSAPAAMSWWQKAKGWLSGALCACACLAVYYYAIRIVYHDKGRNL